MTSACKTLLSRIRQQNLDVYQASPVRVTEDVSQEEQIAGDYSGRLVYELLQNADDAMLGSSGISDRILFRLTDDELLVANSGRPLDEADVQGLCGVGASSKSVSRGPRRASIGHKGMGFKSVLEVTARPEVRSESFGFCMNSDDALEAVTAAMRSGYEPTPIHVPTMRFPWPIKVDHASWPELRDQGYNTVFRFPLRPGLSREKRAILAERLVDLPATAVLFLKHLEQVLVEVETRGLVAHRTWGIERRVRRDSTWVASAGLVASGAYEVVVSATVEDGHRSVWPFLVAHDADVPIAGNRSGLSGSAWEGVEYAEVSVATRWPLDLTREPTDLVGELTGEWARFHVFLPTEERSPYPLIVNGAFATDLSRQEIRIGSEPDNYNRHLLRGAAAVFSDRLAPTILSLGGRPIDVLRVLDRSRVGQVGRTGGVADALHGYVREALAGLPLVSTETQGPATVPGCVVPPTGTRGSLGAALRELLTSDARFESRPFPTADLCDEEATRVLADLGARQLSAIEAVGVLEGADPGRSRLRRHATADIDVDPVLSVLEGLYESPAGREKPFADAVRHARLFPVAENEGLVERIATDDVTCFYPPRSQSEELPLDGLAFILQSICWGGLAPKERNVVLREQMTAWHALFDVREFKFPDVMRASVLPLLELRPGEAGGSGRSTLESLDRLAAICQLSGRSPNTAAPLPYERLGSNRALFNLSRLPVPCRSTDGTGIRWLPAYSVYFGSDWIGGASVENLLDEMRSVGWPDVPDVPLLAGPEILIRHLKRRAGISVAAESDEPAGEDEVDLGEDDDAPPEGDERGRWLVFLTWIGVNRVLRPVHFHDVEDRGSGWLSTAGLRRPDGRAFRPIEGTWDEWAEELGFAALRAAHPSSTWYLYQAHDLAYSGLVLQAAQDDPSARIARALYAHLALNWETLSRFQMARAALVDNGKVPSMRNKPPKPLPEEEHDLGDDLWLFRLRKVACVPTSLGPRQSTEAWLPSGEISRRFDRRGSRSADLLPVLQVPEEALEGRARGFASALKIRDDLSPSTFGEGDAMALLARIAEVFGADVGNGLPEETLRQVIRPAYRNLVDLLVVRSGDEDDERLIEPKLGDAPVLVQDGRGAYRFAPAGQSFYMARSGTRDRLGSSVPIWTFVNEASLTARRPLRLLGMRVLEDELRWHPTPGADALEDDEALSTFRAHVREMAGFALARLRVDRADGRLATQDVKRLDELVGLILPVQSLTLTCSLDGERIAEATPQDHFVETQGGQVRRAFVVWGEQTWPPSRVEAEGLAGAFVDALGTGALEAFLALIAADNDTSRNRLLRRAGASTDIAAAWRGEEPPLGALAPGETVPPPPQRPEQGGGTPVDGTRDGQPGPVTPADDRPRAPLYKPSDLIIEGTADRVTGEPRSGPDRGGRSGEGQGGGDGGREPRSFGGHTDLSELDRLGMYVALTFERNRLRRAGSESAISSWETALPTPGVLVFDVSTEPAIRDALKLSDEFKAAHEFLVERGVPRWVPGFDVLTLDPREPSRPQRLIELKSSGINARTQTMSWNEWKTASSGAIRGLFYLYLVGNLRTDIGDAPPFLRAIRDPFGSLRAKAVEASTGGGSIQLAVREFVAAEEETIGRRLP